jgi:hypothetical protein
MIYKVYAPVGIVASGKTTACHKWAEENNAVIVEADVFRTIFYQKYIYDLRIEDIIWKLMRESTIEWLNHAVNVAVDDAVLFLKRMSRIRFQSEVRLGAWPDYEFIWDFLPIPTDEQIAERRGKDGRGYSVEEWLEVAHRQRGELER